FNRASDTNLYPLCSSSSPLIPYFSCGKSKPEVVEQIYVSHHSFVTIILAYSLVFRSGSSVSYVPLHQFTTHFLQYKENVVASYAWRAVLSLFRLFQSIVLTACGARRPAELPIRLATNPGR